MKRFVSNCPLCQNKSQAQFFPFCSKICEYRDLGIWLKGDYCIAGEPLDDESGISFSEEES